MIQVLVHNIRGVGIFVSKKLPASQVFFDSLNSAIMFGSMLNYMALISSWWAAYTVVHQNVSVAVYHLFVIYSVNSMCIPIY